MNPYTKFFAILGAIVTFNVAVITTAAVYHRNHNQTSAQEIVDRVDWFRSCALAGYTFPQCEILKDSQR